MRDMFYNYDNHINKKEYPKPIHFPEPKNILESNPNAEIVYDIKGNEIGIKVQHNNPFSLFFSLDGFVDGRSISWFIENSTIIFEILNSFHEVELTKELSSEECYLRDFETLKININTEESRSLRAETYGMRLTLMWPDGKYELFAEKDGKLIIR